MEASTLLSRLESLTQEPMQPDELSKCLSDIKRANQPIRIAIAEGILKHDGITNFVDGLILSGDTESDDCLYKWLFEWYQSNEEGLQHCVLRFIPSMLYSFIYHVSLLAPRPMLETCLIGIFNNDMDTYGPMLNASPSTLSSLSHTGFRIPNLCQSSVYHTPPIVETPPSSPHAAPTPGESFPSGTSYASSLPESSTLHYIQHITYSNQSLILCSILGTFISKASSLPVSSLFVFCDASARLVSAGLEQLLGFSMETYYAQFDQQQADKGYYSSLQTTRWSNKWRTALDGDSAQKLIKRVKAKVSSAKAKAKHAVSSA